MKPPVMHPSGTNPEELLQQAVDALRDDLPTAEVEEAAGARALERLRRAAADPQAAAAAAAPAAPAARAAEPAGRLAACEDYRALIPAWVAGELPPARALLVEDHTRECVPCRKALRDARQGGERRTVPSRRRRVPIPWRALASVAAALAVAAGAAYLLFYADLTHGEIARVQSVEGHLFRLGGDLASPLGPGDEVDEGDELRTARGSGAVLVLDDGSRVEIRERSEISLAERRGDATIRVARGGIIVEAAPQRSGHLYVATEDCLVAVTGTIFSVNHGTKGSRVSVFEGEVRVAQGRAETVLLPGQQLATHPGLGAVPLPDEVAWSRDGDRYLALLAELKAIDLELSRALARSGLRYSSRLLGLVPADTGLYFAMPNVAGDLVDIHHQIEQRLAESEVLAAWWQERAGASGFGAELEELVARIGALGEHLGPEIVVAVSLDESGEPVSPLVLAEVVEPAAFAATLAAEVERLNAMTGAPRLVVVSDPNAVVAGADEERVLLWPAGDLFAAAIEPQRLAALADSIARPDAAPFSATPFHHRLAEAYGQGAQWLAGLDLGRILAAQEDPDGAFAFTGIGGVDYLVVERKAGEEVTHTGAVLGFTDQRQGALGWLAAPAAMGSLDFISADANFAAAFVVEEPDRILAEVFRFVEASDPGFRGELERFEAAHGVKVIEDLAAPLGGEIAFALDGPALPEPAWKVVAEVYDPVRFQQAIEWAVAEVDRQLTAEGKTGLALSSEPARGRTAYRLRFPEAGREVHYTFSEGYWIAAPSRALVDRALATRASGYGLDDAPDFQALLPADGYLNFSAVVYSNLGAITDALLGAAQGLQLSDEQRQALDELELDAPTLTCAYGEADRIRLVSTARGGLLGSRLGTLLGLGMLPALGH